MSSPAPALRPLCLLTGANRGIGFAAARALAAGGMRVVLACRNARQAEAAAARIAKESGGDSVETLTVDLADFPSIRAAAQEFLRRHAALDVLINNAAVVEPQRRIGPAGIETTFAVNVLAYHLLTKLLQDALRRAAKARVINVASGMAYGLDLDDVEFQRRPYDAAAAYAQSKQADRMLTWAWARRFAGTTVTANAMSPGPVQTQLLQTLAPGLQGRTAEEGADTLIWLATAPDLEGVNGQFWSNRRERECPYHGLDGEEKLWNLCETLSDRSAT